jgi:alpha-amylase/alpha-mannosidase (GH57 family)
MTAVSVVLHGHFYQPPREDPWTDEVPVESSAAPFHDWNERILAECYRPITRARVLDGRRRIRDIVNTLEWTSWDAGPTLLRWLVREAPDVYRAFIEADRRSARRLGSGNALATPYHHVILPLASRRDKVTEVRWGIADFRRRFGRDPEGMWLPETAVDSETLEVLANEGILFTILAPTQVGSRPKDGTAGRVRLGRTKSIAVFVYDGPLSHGVAFGALLPSSEQWVERVSETAALPGARLVSMAVDGETFGHHHRFGDLALAATLRRLSERSPRLRLENFGSFLARNPPASDVTIVEPSSWSCAHGVDRWKKECGCKTAPHEASQQAWRQVLRESLDELAGELHAYFEKEGRKVLRDPWAARDGYGAVLEAGEAARRAFARARTPKGAGKAAVPHALELLEMERDALRMFTSCGWFFDDLSGLEPAQVLRYAARAIDLAGDSGSAWEAGLRTALAGARSNDPAVGDGRRLWDERIRADRSSEPAALESRAAESKLLTSVRRFTRAPGDPAASRVLAEAPPDPTVGAPDLAEAQDLFARAFRRSAGPTSAAVEAVARGLGFGPGFFTERKLGGTEPVRFVFGLHMHQPVGNFDEVFRAHTEDVYAPLLERFAQREILPITLHVSGPLLEWMDAHDHRLIDLIGRLASDGGVELLLSGLYEPVLPALSRRDRADQIGRMREWIGSRFGVAPTGLWLTERVWEPDLVLDLAQAGVEYAFVDDRHFLVAGFDRDELHRPHETESAGHRLTLLPIDERLRYLVPFRAPHETAEYLRSLRANDRPLAILADDAEKFGGWPGTAEWVWGSGWLDHFLDTLEELSAEGAVRMSTGADAVLQVAGRGPSYLPSASYREMEGWALPTAATLDLEGLAKRLEADGTPESATRFVRGGHWRSFFAKYSESSRMHLKAQALSDLCSRRGDPKKARRAIGRAQCNDAYWHGVFGGLYLRHLRQAVWGNLAEAEEALRRGEGLGVDVLDGDGDGRAEIWIHSGRFSGMVSPARGGAVTELTWFSERRNLADVLTRRWESYHRPSAEAGTTEGEESPDGAERLGGTREGAAAPSIHELEGALAFSDSIPYDDGERALTVERVLPGELDRDAYERADYSPVFSWVETEMEAAYREASDGIEVSLKTGEGPSFEKRLRFSEDGTVMIRYRWDASAFPPSARFAPELTLAMDVDLGMDPPPSDVWRYEVRTFSKSERGPEESVQGLSVTPLWPSWLGAADLAIRRPAEPARGRRTKSAKVGGARHR